MISIEFRLLNRDWSPTNTVTEDQLFDGATFDYYALCIVNQESYDYLSALQLMRGEQLYDMHRTEDEDHKGIPCVYIRVVGLSP